MQKESILAEVRRTAQENGGKPLGRNRFEQLTGITTTDWLRYWSRFGDLQREAGFEPNKLQAAYDDQYLLEKIVELIRELKKFPTNNEKRTKAFNDPGFPSATVFDRLGTKNQLVTKVHTYCLGKSRYKDVIAIIEPLMSMVDNSEAIDRKAVQGFVYLLKERPGHYKIGVSDDPERRLYELTKGPYRPELEHKIQTDDPFGIEAYWHKRFAEKLMRGEWFKLNHSDIVAFKRWRKIF